MTIATKAERLAADLHERAIVAYGVLISALEAGESVAPVAILRILTVAGKSFDDLDRDRQSLTLAAQVEGLIVETRGVRDQAVDVEAVGVVLDMNERMAHGRRQIESIQTTVFGDYERETSNG